MRAVVALGFGLGLGAEAFAAPKRATGVGAATKLHAVWSNPQAVEDYQAYLNGVEEVVAKDQPSVFVGGADMKVAQGLAAFGRGDDVVLNSIAQVPAQVGGKSEFPIYACVAPGEMEALINACPEEKRDDLIILQRGEMMEPMLKRYGLCGKKNTQAICYFDFHPISGKPIDYIVDLGTDVQGNPKYASETTVTGKWAGAMLERLQRNEMHCDAIGYYEWRREMIQRNLFEVIFSLVGALHQGSTAGEVGDFYKDEVEDMWRSFNRCIRGHLAVTMLYGVEERFWAMADSSRRNGAPTMKVDDPELWPWFHGYWMGVDELYAKKLGGSCIPVWREYFDYGIEKGIFKDPRGPEMRQAA